MWLQRVTAVPCDARVSAGRRRAPVCPTPARSAWGRGASSWLSLGPEARTPGAEAPKSNRVSAADHRASGRPLLSTRFYLDSLLQFRCHCKLSAASTSPVSQKCRFRLPDRPQWEHTSHGPFWLGSWHLVDTVGDMSSRPRETKSWFEGRMSKTGWTAAGLSKTERGRFPDPVECGATPVSSFLLPVPGLQVTSPSRPSPPGRRTHLEMVNRAENQASHLLCQETQPRKSAKVLGVETGPSTYAETQGRSHGSAGNNA